MPSDAICFYRDGNMVCCVRGDFLNLQESPAGFGKDRQAAESDLERQLRTNASIIESPLIYP